MHLGQKLERVVQRSLANSNYLIWRADLSWNGLMPRLAGQRAVKQMTSICITKDGLSSFRLLKFVFRSVL